MAKFIHLTSHNGINSQYVKGRKFRELSDIGKRILPPKMRDYLVRILQVARYFLRSKILILMRT